MKNSTLTVAAFNPFTGPDASFGPEMMAGCLTAATAVNAAGGVLSNKVACSSVDTRGDPADAVTAAAKMLATTPHLFGVLGPSSDEADSTAPLINAAKIPMFADTGEASFDHTKLQYFWRMTPADDVQGDAMALYAKQKGYLRAAAVFGNDIGSQASRADAAEELTAHWAGRLSSTRRSPWARPPISRRSSSSSRPSRRSSSPKPRRRPTRRTWPSCSSWAT